MRGTEHTLDRDAARSWICARDAALIVGFAGVTALSAMVSVRLPFTPVPITGQTLAVLLCGGLLGSRRGAAAQMVYVGLGSLGLSVFARTGTAAGPTGGYVLGFIAMAYVVGRLCEGKRSLWRILGAMALGEIVLYLCGAPWLACYVGGPASKVMAMGVYPFLLGDVLKIAIAAGVVTVRARMN